MKKGFFSCLGGCVLVLLAMAGAAPGGHAGPQDMPIKIEPDLTKVVPAIDGGQPPTFTVETEPRAAVSIMVATDFDSLITEKGQSIAKVFISYFGSDIAKIPAAELRSDDEGRLSYTLPASVFEAMSNSATHIYYVAEVIAPKEEGHYDTLGVSFDYQNGSEPDAPRIAVDHSPRLAKAADHFKAGEKHYMKQDYEAAVSEFQAAQAIAPHPNIEYNIGICHLKLCLKSLNGAVDARQFSAREEARVQQFVATAENFIKTVQRPPDGQ